MKEFKFLSIILLFLMLLSFTRIESDKVHINPQSTELNTEGLYYAEFFDYIYRGHFENIKIKRKDTEFLMIFEQYLRTYGAKCSSYLPTNKVKIMEQECAKEQVTTNGYGIETSRVCIKWRWVWSGLYAKPDLYNAKMEIESMQRADGLRTAIDMITNPNALGNSVDMMHKIKGLKNDMVLFFKINQCNSVGVKQFEENLKLFALNKPAIRMKESSKYATMKKAGGPTGSQNFNMLIDDLVANQAKTWSFNRYTRGSISGLTIQSKDNKGRPRELKANYVYSGFGNGSKGWVRVTFTNGLPDCIYFFDFPNNCKTPNSSIVASFAQGKYKK